MQTQVSLSRDGQFSLDEGVIAEVYDNLRALAAAYSAQESYKQAPTSIVHEAILRVGNLRQFKSRIELFAAVAQTIRRSLVDRARRRHTLKRGKNWRFLALDPAELPAPESVVSVLDFDDLLSRLGQSDPRAARVVELRFFGGLDLAQVAVALGLSRKTVFLDWAFARAWISKYLARSSGIGQ